MPKAAAPHDLALRPPRGRRPRFAWLYDELRAAILSGRLLPDRRLPSTRSLATAYRVARGTVVAVFEQLGAEGYLASRVGAGTRVCSTLPDHFLETGRRGHPAVVRHSRAGLSARGRQLAAGALPASVVETGAPAFRTNQPDLEVFPTAIWARLAGRRMRAATRPMLAGGDALGYEPLRTAIAAYLGQTRGLHCTADQVAITSGTQQALDLCSRLLLDAGDSVLVEDPGYAWAAAVFRANGATVVPRPVDDEGLTLPPEKSAGAAAKLAYVTPAHQFPLGFTMSVTRRLALLDWAQRNGAWIFEDDYDGEFRFSGRPMPALQSLDAGGSVVYASSFSKVLFPSLRLGYVVLPARIVPAFARTRSLFDRYPPVLEQAVLCDFITEGHFGRHVRLMRERYARRLALLTQQVQQQLGDRLALSAVRAGLHVIGWLPRGCSDVAVAAAAAREGVEVSALSPLTLRPGGKPGLILGFGAADEAEIRRGVAVLARIVRAAPSAGKTRRVIS